MERIAYYAASEASVRSAADLKRATSAYERAIIIAPSSAPTSDCATRRRALELERLVLLALLEHAHEPALVRVEVVAHLVAHRLGERAELGGEHPAQAHAVVAQHVLVDGGVAAQLLARVAAAASIFARRARKLRS
jgi:hypothetical protein